MPNAQLMLGNAALSAATAEGQVSVLDVPNALARVASPLAFPDLVSSAATARGFDPLLFTSLMHQESDFDPYAESVARAKGLTQIIPQTGTEIARALGVAGLQPGRPVPRQTERPVRRLLLRRAPQAQWVRRSRPGRLQRRRRQRRHLDTPRPRRPGRLYRVRPVPGNQRLRQEDPDVLVDQSIRLGWRTLRSRSRCTRRLRTQAVTNRNMTSPVAVVLISCFGEIRD